MAAPFVRNSVPDKSKLEILVTPIVPEGSDPANARFVATGLLQVPGGTNKNWTDQQLRAGVAQVLRSDPNAFVSYDGWVELAFAGSAEAELLIVIDKPDGSHHRQRSVIKRKSGIDHTTIVITMAKS
jgi:hypothetical protein